MFISIGDITAACAHCGNADFEPPAAGGLRLASELKCLRCGTTVQYLALLDQIGEEAMRRANRSIEELKKPPKG
jgi:hypothetical protein